ncbi:cytochrome P450 monooxygenase-like protein [Trematosphaeria pertusa]|uniref:Cytochrome P450 monooxygenase-like protein n=1 Tax=Trematosphaeria pertusa TaxID=390896 RepID=A0A6A6HXZ7_9PLEO|nr:cytochrome P450 monooxygenase-like protein [Trematosphaeria pertusa]KAF2242602.1 cytochrome P450 monooxygenase-like protein [Trematosphaeria pertusa]
MSFFHVFLVFSALPLAFAGWSAITLVQNYKKASSTGLPITIRFISPGSPLWMMLSPLIMRIAEYLPFTTSFIATYRRGWEARERCRPHVKMGDLFMICTPGGNWLKVCHPLITSDILKRKWCFERDLDAFEVLNIYGKNLATSQGEDWNRHRKVSAATFTEKNHELVWRESLKVGRQMLEYWLYRFPKPVRTLAQDTRVFTLNVLAAALFDKSYPFESREESEARERRAVGAKDAAFGYRDSLCTILRQIVPIMVFGEQRLRDSWWLPASWRRAGHAVSDFRNYVTELINEERALLAQGKQNTPNLVTNLVRASEEGDGSLKAGNPKPKQAILTKDEIISDLFVFAFAGNDTTAITLTHIIAFMAARPDVQDWVSEEIHYHLYDDDETKWDYVNCAELKRCWAVVYETLRLCHPLGQIVKTTGLRPRVLQYKRQSVVIPEKTTVEINLPALQTHPLYWDRGLSWQPGNFIRGAGYPEILRSDVMSDFLPWSVGRGVCPGKRFSQVELVAVLVALFRDHRVEPVPEKGESMQEARQRVERHAKDVEMRLLNEMREPERVALRWYKVEQRVIERRP